MTRPARSLPGALAEPAHRRKFRLCPSAVACTIALQKAELVRGAPTANDGELGLRHTLATLGGPFCPRQLEAAQGKNVCAWECLD